MSTLPPRALRALLVLWLLAGATMAVQLLAAPMSLTRFVPIGLVALLMAALDQVAVSVLQADGETHIVALNDAALAIAVLLLGGDGALAIALGLVLSEWGFDRLRGVRRRWFRTLTNVSSYALYGSITAGAVAGIDRVWAGTALHHVLAVLLAGGILVIAPKLWGALFFARLQGTSVQAMLTRILAESQLYNSVALIVGLLAAACLRIVGGGSIEIVVLVLLLGLALIGLARSSIQLIADLEQRVASRTAELATANGELARVMEARARETRAVQHDLKGPIYAAKMGLEVILNNADPPIHVLLDPIRHILGRTEHQLAQLLDVAQMEQTTLQLDMQPTDVVALLRDSMTMLRPGFAGVGCDLTAALPGDPAIACIDRPRLHRVFLNVLENARRYTVERDDIDPQVHVALCMTTTTIIITVTDNGRGIAADDLTMLGTEFVRVAVDARSGGSGLGLAYVRRILAQMHSTLTLTSPGVGHGTTATITIPRDEESRCV